MCKESKIAHLACILLHNRCTEVDTFINEHVHHPAVILYFQASKIAQHLWLGCAAMRKSGSDCRRRTPLLPGCAAPGCIPPLPARPGRPPLPRLARPPDASARRNSAARCCRMLLERLCAPNMSASTRENPRVLHHSWWKRCSQGAPPSLCLFTLNSHAVTHHCQEHDDWACPEP